MNKKGNLYVLIIGVMALVMIAFMFTMAFKIYQKTYDRLSPDFTGDAATRADQMYKIVYYAPVVLLLTVLAWMVIASQKEQPGNYFQ